MKQSKSDNHIRLRVVACALYIEAGRSRPLNTILSLNTTTYGLVWSFVVGMCFLFVYECVD